MSSILQYYISTVTHYFSDSDNGTTKGIIKACDCVNLSSVHISSTMSWDIIKESVKESYPCAPASLRTRMYTHTHYTSYLLSAYCHPFWNKSSYHF